jgi:iron-sulfur cluster assembly protein
VDAKSLEVLDGSTLDYVKEGLKQVFKFSNPNVDATCGCGESFSVKDKD